MKVVYDPKEKIYLCIGHGFSFKAWFAGQGVEQSVEAEVFDDAGAILDYIYAPAPEGSPAPGVAAIAAAFEPKLINLRAQLNDRRVA